MKRKDFFITVVSLVPAYNFVKELFLRNREPIESKFEQEWAVNPYDYRMNIYWYATTFDNIEYGLSYQLAVRESKVDLQYMKEAVFNIKRKMIEDMSKVSRNFKVKFTYARIGYMDNRGLRAIVQEAKSIGQLKRMV